MDALWKRIRDGRYMAIVGGTVPDPPEDAGILLLRVACDRPGGPLSPLLDARHAVKQLLGEDATSEPPVAPVTGPRRRLLDGGAGPRLRVELVHDLNRLAGAAEGTCVLLFDAVDRADRATLELLGETVLRDGWLNLPLVFTFRQEPTTDEARQLLQAIAELGGEGAIVRAGAPSAPAAADVALPDLKPEVLLVLRAATTIGPVFEAELVGLLLGMDGLGALELLQAAHDAGVPLEDRGDGSFAMPVPLAAHVAAGILPSLEQAWHRRLGLILGHDGERQARQPEADPVAPEGAATATEPSPDRRADTQARAARHLASAGDVDAAAERLLDAAREANALGAFMDAVAYAMDAVRSVERMPRSSQRRVLLARAEAEIGRAKWLGASPERAYTLAEARRPLEQALDLLEDGDPPALRAEVLAILASVLYDSGDREALEGALEKLVEASRLLEGAGRPVDAARLLNDQAAVWVRLGDTTRAHRLLKQSRQVFETLAEDDPVTQVELAETDHLIARLPLHVPARPGREADAIDVGLEHARAAEERYHELGDERELARVWETIGRLEALRGKADVAIEWLRRAVPVHQELGDFLGLARTAEALSRTLASVGQPEDALVLLSDSVALNEEKGSPVGLAYNRRSLEGLVGSLSARQQRALGEAVRAVDERIARAEARVGKAIFLAGA